MNAPDDLPEADPLKAGDEGLPRPAAAPPDQPHQIGRYQIKKLLGKGGMGVVYLAHDHQLDRAVALKVPHFGRVPRPEDAEAFRREVRAVAKLDHPNILPVYDVGAAEDCPCFIVTKHFEGITLAKRIKANRPSVSEAAQLVALVAEALHHAHRNGLVHRNINPDSILLDTNGKPLLVDFGLAIEEMSHGHGASVVATAAYMSPEQARGEGYGVDGRSDVFSLGVVFYELLVGRRPFQGESLTELVMQVTTSEPRAPRQYDESIPRELERICLKALAKRASERYTTAKDMADDLRRFLAQTSGPTSKYLPSAAATPLVGSPSNLAQSGTLVTPALGQAVLADQSAHLSKRSHDLGSWVKKTLGRLFGLASARSKPEPTSPISEARQPPLPPPYDPSASRPGGGGESVDCAVFAPPEIDQGEVVLVQIFGYATGREDEAKRQATEFDEGAVRRGVTTLEMPIRIGQALQFYLTLGSLKIENPVRQLIWHGRTASVQYEVTIPHGCLPGNLVGTVIIGTDNVPVGRIGFKLRVVTRRSQPAPNAPVSVGESATRFRKAFVSYDSEDRAAVLARLQMLRPPLYEIEVFQDILSLTPGERWQRELYRRIDECDLFLLFWSTNARQSEWVRREWEYALNRQGSSREPPPTIFPVIIEGPPPPTPPPELEHLHFNDYLLYFAK